MDRVGRAGWGGRAGCALVGEIQLRGWGWVLVLSWPQPASRVCAGGLGGVGGKG